MMSTKFRASDLVPAGFTAERITHIDDETRIVLSRAVASAACPACGRMSRTVRSRYCRQVADLPSLGNASGCSYRHEDSLAMPCSAADKYSLSGLARSCFPMPDEPDASNISSTIWRLRLAEDRRRVLPNG